MMDFVMVSIFIMLVGIAGVIALSDSVDDDDFE